MTKGARKGHRLIKPAKPDKPKTEAIKNRYNNRQFTFILIFIFLAAIPFCIGKYIEIFTPDAFDSGAYIYSAKHILDGAKIGVDEKPSAQLGTLLVNILGVWLFGYNEIGPELIMAVLQLSALAAMFVAMRRLFGTFAAGAGTIIASFYLSSPLLAKYGNVKEQYMIAFMLLGISFFVLYELGGRWRHCLLAGAFLGLAPLFKQTAMSAIAATGLFVIAQPLLGHKTIKKTARDILLLFAGAAVATGPIYVWLIGWKVNMGLPYAFVWNILIKKIYILFPAAGGGQATTGYLATSRRLVSFSEQWPRVLRYYGLLLLPISLSFIAIGGRLIKTAAGRIRKTGIETYLCERFVLLLSVWWILDTAFVWISPRSYEQYYLPMTSSGAFLAGYAVWLYTSKLNYKAQKLILKNTAIRDFLLLIIWIITATIIVQVIFTQLADRDVKYHQYRIVLSASVVILGLGPVALLMEKFSPENGFLRWALVGITSLVCMVIMAWPVVFGIQMSTHTAANYGSKKRGYVQRFRAVSQLRTKSASVAWENVGEYIRNRTSENDRIYVWGWVPGIYVKAQRLSPTSRACIMPRPAPANLKASITEILADFQRERPKFIVDSRKLHIPTNRPPYELWPIARIDTPGGKAGWFLPDNQIVTEKYDKWWAELLREKFGDAEAERYLILAPLRKFVMDNYEIVEPKRFIKSNFPFYMITHQFFGEHIVYKLKE